MEIFADLSHDWWRGAVIYQIYPRSFQDTNGDGIGDLPGVLSRLAHIAALGADAIWLSPFYTSPMADFGYDVADHTAVDSQFGTLADFDRVVAEAKRLGLRVMVDLVVGHTSDAHSWFRDSRRGRDGDKADWYVWADPQADGTPPNNWLSVFSGPAWTWEPRRRQYYLHHFLARQPSLNLRNPRVRDALVDVARFWLERGVEGLRLDAIDFLAHDPDLRGNPASGIDPSQAPAKLFGLQRHVNDMLHEDGHALLHDLRRLADDHGAVLLGEVSSQPGAFDRIARYTGHGGPLHTAYTLSPMRGGFDHTMATALVREAARPDASVCFAFSNHDAPRVATRWCLGEDGTPDRRKLELVAAFQLALRGQICVYQGEELGLTEAKLAFDDLRDPFGIAFWPEFNGRDGSRTPMPWSADAPGLGFSDGKPWLPLPAEHGALAADRQADDPASLLGFWRRLLAWRRASPEIVSGDLTPLDLPAPIVGFERQTLERRTLCLFNLSGAPVSLRFDGETLELGAYEFRFRSGTRARLDESVAA